MPGKEPFLEILTNKRLHNFQCKNEKCNSWVFWATCGLSSSCCFFYRTTKQCLSNDCLNLRMFWQILIAHLMTRNGRWLCPAVVKYIREAKGKCIHYKILHRYYWTPLKLCRMGLIKSNLCWKCQKETHFYIANGNGKWSSLCG